MMWLDIRIVLLRLIGGVVNMDLFRVGNTRVLVKASSDSRIELTLLLRGELSGRGRRLVPTGIVSWCRFVVLPVVSCNRASCSRLTPLTLRSLTSALTLRFAKRCSSLPLLATLHCAANGQANQEQDGKAYNSRYDKKLSVEVNSLGSVSDETDSLSLAIIDGEVGAEERISEKPVLIRRLSGVFPESNIAFGVF